VNELTPQATGAQHELPAWFAELLAEAALQDTDESVQASAVTEHAAPSSNGPRG
jgi:hypothetical protein